MNVSDFDEYLPTMEHFCNGIVLLGLQAYRKDNVITLGFPVKIPVLYTYVQLIGLANPSHNCSISMEGKGQSSGTID